MCSGILCLTLCVWVVCSFGLGIHVNLSLGVNRQETKHNKNLLPLQGGSSHCRGKRYTTVSSANESHSPQEPESAPPMMNSYVLSHAKYIMHTVWYIIFIFF